MIAIENPDLTVEDLDRIYQRFKVLTNDLAWAWKDNHEKMLYLNSMRDNCYRDYRKARARLGAR